MDDIVVVNDIWTDAENDTLGKWLELLTRTIFIYDYTLSKYRSIFRKISIINIILSALSAGVGMCTTTLLGNYSSENTTQSLINDNSSIYVSLALSIFSVVATCTISGVNSIKVLYGWENMINNINSHIRTAIDLRASLNIQSSLPFHLRKNVREYMLKYTQKLETFQAESPNIGEENFTAANREYEQYIQSPKSVRMLISLGKE